MKNDGRNKKLHWLELFRKWDFRDKEEKRRKKKNKMPKLLYEFFELKPGWRVTARSTYRSFDCNCWDIKWYENESQLSGGKFSENENLRSEKYFFWKKLKICRNTLFIFSLLYVFLEREPGSRFTVCFKAKIWRVFFIYEE